MNDLAPDIRAYIAGLVDGEGCVGIYSCGISRRVREHFTLQVKVSSTDHEILMWLRDVTGIGRLRSQRSRPRCKPAWVWETKSRQATALLVSIHPWLRIKKPQADTAIEFAGTMTPRGTVHRIGEEVYAHREVLRRRLRMMNRRGPDLVGIGDIRVESE